MPVMARYACVTLTPLALLLAAPAWHGLALVALVYLTLAAAALDWLLGPPRRAPEDHAPWSDALSVTLALGHLLVLPVVVATVTRAEMAPGLAVALLAATASFFGQVSHPNAHELIHRRGRMPKLLGAAVYASVGFGHHVSAHRLVHHRNVGTLADPNTPRTGEGFWRYLPRAWAGSFRAGLGAEIARLGRRGLGPRDIRNPYWLWLGWSLLWLAIAAGIGGLAGMAVVILLGGLTGAQILLSDYIQHYGLRRLPLQNGRLEPVAAHHSWNAPRGFSSYLMMNAPAHSEHHLHPDVPYDQLDPTADVPRLPRSLPVMAVVATVPPLWRRMMDGRAKLVVDGARARIAAGEVQATPEPRRPSVLRAAARAAETAAAPPAAQAG